MNDILLKSLNDVNQGKVDFTELDIDKNVEFYIVGIARMFRVLHKNLYTVINSAAYFHI